MSYAAAICKTILIFYILEWGVLTKKRLGNTDLKYRQSRYRYMFQMQLDKLSKVDIHFSVYCLDNYT